MSYLREREPEGREESNERYCSCDDKHLACTAACCCVFLRVAACDAALVNEREREGGRESEESEESERVRERGERWRREKDTERKGGERGRRKRERKRKNRR